MVTKNRLNILFLTIFVFLLLAVSIYWSFAASYDHDENQFIASAAILVQNGSIPYLDYAYFHMPYGVLLNAIPAYFFSENIYIATRLFTSIFWVLSISVLSFYFLSLNKDEFNLITLTLASVLLLIIFFDETMSRMLGKAFNHALPTFFSILSLIFFLRASNNDTDTKRVFIAGLFIGIASCIRLSFAVVVLPISIYIISCFNPKLMKMAFLGFFTSLIPALILFMVNPNNFIFGNIIYINLNTVYRETTGYAIGMELISKIKYVANYLLRNPPILVTYFITALLTIKWLINLRKQNQNYNNEKWLLISVTFLELIMGLIPTPIFIQYLFAPLPFIVLLLARYFSELENTSRVVILSLFLLSAIPIVPKNIDRFLENPDSNQWDTIKITFQAEKIKQFPEFMENNCKILTLMPILALQTGCDIYPEFVTGAFAWRVTPYVDQADRKKLKLVGMNNLDQFLTKYPPNIIITGVENGRIFDDFGNDTHIERPFRDFAKSNNYQIFSQSGYFKKNMIWLESIETAE